MASLVKAGKHGFINTADTTTNGFYFIKFISEAYTIQKIKQLTDKLFLLVNYLSGHNIFAPCKKFLIGIGKKTNCSRIS